MARSLFRGVEQGGTLMVLRAGYLVKRGRLARTWKKRWFVLYEDRLLYFADHSTIERKGFIPLHASSTCAPRAARIFLGSPAPGAPNSTWYARSPARAGSRGRAPCAGYPQLGSDTRFTVMTDGRELLLQAGADRERIEWVSAICECVAAVAAETGEHGRTH